MPHPWGVLPPFPLPRNNSLPQNNAWNWQAWAPHAVVINLGTNDFCCGQGAPPQFTSALAQFMVNLTSVLAPGQGGAGGLPVLAVTGPITNATAPYIAKAVALAAQQGVQAQLVDQWGVLDDPATYVKRIAASVARPPTQVPAHAPFAGISAVPATPQSRGMRRWLLPLCQRCVRPWGGEATHAPRHTLPL